MPPSTKNEIASQVNQMTESLEQKTFRKNKNNNNNKIYLHTSNAFKSTNSLDSNEKPEKNYRKFNYKMKQI